MLKIYIAGPYTIGDVAENVSKAMQTAHSLMDYGMAPFCPHLSHYLHLQRQRKYSDWIELDAEFVKVCDALLRLPGKSVGADMEVAQAKELGIPVFDSLFSLVEWKNDWGKRAKEALEETSDIMRKLIAEPPKRVKESFVIDNGDNGIRIRGKKKCLTCDTLLPQSYNLAMCPNCHLDGNNWNRH